MNNKFCDFVGPHLPHGRCRGEPPIRQDLAVTVVDVGPPPPTSGREPKPKVWRIIDFRPAPAGWRAIYLSPTTPYWRAEALAGWAIYEQAVVNDVGDVAVGYSYVDSHNRARDVVAVIYDADRGLIRVHDLPRLYAVLGPGQPDPSDRTIARARYRAEEV